MKAVVLNKPGGVEELNLKNVEKPIPQDNEVLVKVKAAAVNRTDIVSREGCHFTWYMVMISLNKWEKDYN